MLLLYIVQELEEEASGPPDLPALQTRIKESEQLFRILRFFLRNQPLTFVRCLMLLICVSVVRVLSNFKDLRPEGVKRKEFVEQLKADLASYYGYNEFLIGTLVEVIR